ncbi:MAG TPA: response regulator [Bryobacteraceae bacterium]|nr:response regulator [Bryobacteraceae bacterium]
MKKRILFVDDEPQALEALDDLLYKYQAKWEMVFAGSGASAVDRMNEMPFDVIVTDVKMPGMDGIALLGIVRDQHPETIRIALSGLTELEGSLRAMPVLHQFLHKPCDPAMLEGTIERACDLRALVSSEGVRKIVGGLKQLPSLPSVYTDLQQALTDQRCGIRDIGAKDIARIIEQDIGMCAKVLQLVNSAFFGLGRRITVIDDAVAYLGIEMINQIVLAATVFDRRRLDPRGGISLEALRDHGLLVAGIARRIMWGDRRLAGDAWMAGLLHDIGKLVLAAELPAQLAEAVEQARREKRPLYEVEQDRYGVSHAEIGAYLLGTWGLPYPIVEAVANHHAPGRVKHRGLDILTAVHAADALAHELNSSDDVGPGASLNGIWLASAGLEDRVEEWRELAAELTEACV